VDSLQDRGGGQEQQQRRGQRAEGHQQEGQEGILY
jgi:hypothetical protein